MLQPKNGKRPQDRLRCFSPNRLLYLFTYQERKRIFTLIVTLVFYSSLIHAQDSQLYKDYVSAQNSGNPSTLKDYSYAGYHFGEKPIPNIQGPIFDVTKYGAKPNDNEEDYDGIQRAINAAEKAGGGVVFFPKGRFLINEEKPVANQKARPPILISSSNIVLRGSGNSEEGTVLYCKYNRSEFKKWNIQFMIKDRKYPTIDGVKITKSAKVGDKSMTFSSTSRMSVNDVIRIDLADESAFTAEDIAPFQSQFNELIKRWDVMARGRYIIEPHQIKSIKGNVVTFYEPIKHNINTKFKWVVRKLSFIEEVGVENLMMEGNSTADFVHHKDSDKRNVINPSTGLSEYDFHDGGYSGISFVDSKNIWVKNVNFKNWSNTLSTSYCYNATITDVLITGHNGHNSYISFKSNNILLNRFTDNAKYWHGPETSHSSTGTVFRDCSWGTWRPPDFHGGYPYYTLIDNCDGGLGGTPGGGGAPHHGPDLVFWNYTENDTRSGRHSFWQKKYFIRPIFVGYQGRGSFDNKTVHVLESMNKEASPKFLYDEQLKLRIGIYPYWLEKDADQLPTVSFLKPTTNSFKEGENLTVEVKAESEAGIAKVELYFYDDFVRKESLAPYTWNDASLNQVDPVLDNLKAGKHTLRAVATDNSGQVSEATLEITVSNGRPIAANIPNGVYYIQNPAGDLRITNPTGRTVSKTKNTGTSAKWQITKVGSYYTIKNIRNKEFLEVPYGACNKKEDPRNTNVSLGTYTNDSDNHQRWNITQLGNDYFLQPLHCTKVIDRNYDGLMHLWTYQEGNGNQNWRIVSAQGARISHDGAEEGLVAQVLEQANSTITIYPIPVHGDYFTIDLGKAEGSLISVMDVQGKVVYQEKTNDRYVKLSKKGVASSGLYIVRVEQKGATVMKKVLFQ